MKKKKLSPLWLIPAVVIIALILWCIRFPLTMFAGLSEDAEPLSATVMVDRVPEIPMTAYMTDDTEELNQIVEQLRGVRGRFMGWFSMITYNEDPLLQLFISGNMGQKKPFGFSLSADSDGYIYIHGDMICLRAKDAALYEYLTELAMNSEESTPLNDGWNYTPSDNPIETVVSAILGEGEKDYCRSVEFHEAELDWDGKEWAVQQYANYRDGWTEEYLQEHMMVVSAAYTVDYDGQKTFLPSGKMERAFFLLWNAEIQKWEIWESADMPVGERNTVEDTEKQAPAVPEITVDPSLYEQAQTQVFSYGDTLSVRVTNVLKTEKRVLPAEDNFEYTVYTVLPDAEIEVMHAAMSETSDQGLVGDWVLYDTIGNSTFIVPYMDNIPITETTRGIGSESVCVLVFEMYTGEETGE
ncbi:MAG: hypothetical protein IJE94_06890 [Oscillospiraceae bacterium]|nr:hypothetical protein [Oscillospiraceae bacterium]